MREPQYTNSPSGLSLAFLEDGPADDGRYCGFFWLGGFKSDMTGSKAEAVALAAEEMQRPCLRFDYSGHGRSAGAFTDGTISQWLSEADHMLRILTNGPRIVIGSSMGGYLALLLAMRGVGNIKGLVLIAPATDMTEELMMPEIEADAAAREALHRAGVWMRPSQYGDPYPITRKLLEDGRRHLVLAGGIALGCPVRILHGDRDPDVPWQHGLRTFQAITSPDVQFTLVRDGDHRLSREPDIRAICRAAEDLAIDAEGGIGP